MAWTAADLEVIERAIAGPEMSVTFSDGRQVTYRSVSELLKARDAMKNALATGGTRCTYGTYSKE